MAARKTRQICEPSQIQEHIQTLAADANRLCREVDELSRHAVLKAKEAGEVYQRIKTAVGRGNFEEWKQQNHQAGGPCPWTVAQYMKIAKDWKRIESEVMANPKFSVNQAYELLRSRKPNDRKAPPGGIIFLKKEFRDRAIVVAESFNEQQLQFFLERVESGKTRLEEILESAAAAITQPGSMEAAA